MKYYQEVTEDWMTWDPEEEPKLRKWIDDNVENPGDMYSIADLLTVDSYRNAVKSGGFIDYDGDGKIIYEEDGRLWVGGYTYPSEIDNLPETTKYIMWYNK